MTATRVNPLLYAGVTEHVVPRPADALGLARNDADARAGFELFQANATLTFRDAHFLRGHKGWNKPLFYLLCLSGGTGSTGNTSVSQRVGEPGPGERGGHTGRRRHGGH